MSIVRHIILWQLKDELSPAEKAAAKTAIKQGLEGLSGRIPGLLSIRVHTEGLASSNADLMLESIFESEDALQGYAVHPEHVAVATGTVRPRVKTRLCLDFPAEG